MIAALVLWQCSALNTGTGLLYYAKANTRIAAERAANRLCEAYTDPDDPHGCFTYKCAQLPSPAPSPTPACSCNAAHTACTCEIDPNGPGSEMFIKR